MNQSAQDTENNTKKNSRARSIIIGMWVTFLVLVGCVFFFFFLIYNGAIGYMPPVEELKNPQDRFASVVYSADGEELGRYFADTGNRVYAEFDDISQYVIDALVATEDSRFGGALLESMCGRWGCVARKDIADESEECWRRFYSHSAAGEAAVFPHVPRIVAARVAEADRMDDCHKARTLLFERGDNEDVSQSV